MPAPSSLGNFTFRNWLGEMPPKLRQTTQVIQRPGVDYEAVRWLGKRSGPVQTISAVDVPTQIAGRLIYQDYIDAIEEVFPRQLIWFGYNFDIEFTRFIVTGCDLISLRRKHLICGALTPGYTWDLQVRWRLIMTPYSPP